MVKWRLGSTYLKLPHYQRISLLVSFLRIYNTIYNIRILTIRLLRNPYVYIAVFLFYVIYIFLFIYYPIYTYFSATKRKFDSAIIEVCEEIQYGLKLLMSRVLSGLLEEEVGHQGYKVA